MRLVLVYIIMLFAFNAQAGAARPGQILVSDAYVRGLPPGQTTTAAFLSLTNKSNEACVLTSASTPIAERAELHSHSHQGGVMRMRRVDKLVIPAGKTVQLEPGGYHLMLFELQKPLLHREKVAFILHFGDCGSLRVSIPVVNVMYEAQN